MNNQTLPDHHLPQLSVDLSAKIGRIDWFMLICHLFIPYQRRFGLCCQSVRAWRLMLGLSLLNPDLSILGNQT